MRNNGLWWVFVVIATLIVFAWPPREGKSLAVKVVNWAVDPRDELPVLPEELPLGMEHDYEAVTARDFQLHEYDEFYGQGGWTRRRLELKVATDPFDPTTARQVLVALAAVTGLVGWRLAGRKEG